MLPLPRGGLGGRLLPGRGVRARRRRLARRAALSREPARAPSLPREAPRPEGAERARRLLLASLRLRGLSFAVSEAGRIATARRGSRRPTPRSRRALTVVLLYLRLASRLPSCSLRAGCSRERSASGAVGDPRLVARRRLRRARGHVRARLDADADARTARLVAAAGVALRRFRTWPSGRRRSPRRAWALFWGGIVGVLLWRVAAAVGGDGLFHLARVRKLLDLDDSRSTGSRSSPTAASIPATRSRSGTASSRSSRSSRARTRASSSPSPVDPRAACRRRRVRGGVGAVPPDVGRGGHRGGAGRARLLRAGQGRRLRLPLAARHRVAPAPRTGRTRARAGVPSRSPSRGSSRRRRPPGSPWPLVHPTYATFVLDPVRRLPRRRALWERADLSGSLALAALVGPAALSCCGCGRS